MIQARDMCKSFGKQQVLNKLNLNVGKASVYGLLGANGAGKTTLIKHLSGVYKADQGCVSVCGESIYNNPASLGKLFYIPDELYFFGQYSIEEMARFYAGMYPSWNWDRFNALKEAFPIASNRRIVKLSKGMQKQAAFWLAISSMPQVMLMDEPVDGLDPVMRKQVWNLMLQDVAEREMTVLVSSHNLRELEDVCDCIGILQGGGIFMEKDMDDLKTNIHKLQVAFSSEEDAGIPDDLFRNAKVLSHTDKGSIHLLIVRGDKDGIFSDIRRRKPVILDVLPLTLEEIFIYELGGMGYEVKNILI